MSHWPLRLPLLAIALLLVSAALPAQSAHAVGYVECTDIELTNFDPDPACAAVMESHPVPTVLEVPQDTFTLSNYSYWKVITEGAANVYDAPNGGVVRQIEPGFNFIIAVDTNSAPGWIEIQGGGWMRETDLRYTPPSYHRGVTITDGLRQPFGWVMFPLFPASEVGGQQDVDTGRFMDKYERFNVFASVVDDEGIIWYLIGDDEWVEQRWVAIAKPAERPEGVSGRWLAIDLYEQTLIGYENDVPVFATLIASGLPNSDTRQGLFTVWARAIRDPMSGASGSPRSYALQDVPWVMYFDGDIALHGTYWHDGFGYRRSRGCVNLSISDARWIFEWTGENPPDENGEPLTYVYVYSSGVYGQFGIAQG
jgi:hypothetical protein